LLPFAPLKAASNNTPRYSNKCGISESASADSSTPCGHTAANSPAISAVCASNNRRANSKINPQTAAPHSTAIHTPRLCHSTGVVAADICPVTRPTARYTHDNPGCFVSICICRTGSSASLCAISINQVPSLLMQAVGAETSRRTTSANKSTPASAAIGYGRGVASCIAAL